MQWKDVAQNWTAFTPRILTRWPALDEDEVLAIDGDQDGFLTYLSKTKGEDPVAAQMELADWLMGEEPADVVMDPTRDNARIKASGQNIPAGEDALSDDKRFGDDDTPEPPVAKAS
ncbi:hypothetical protein ACJ5NV_17730 [Loktanella agnita]|uniref:hypothetical protein n=1 Tax=Loktanella agnita TaxID=287097 RepID=UPI0039894A73